MIPFIYDFLLFSMLLILYRAGLGLKKNGGRIMSGPGIAAIMAYTLNEGLRFGRDIDYNGYWLSFVEVSRGYGSDREFVYETILKLFSDVGIPFQGFVMFGSFMFIFGLLFFLRNYQEILPFSLPFFALLSLLEVECLIRWFIGYSFILIGLHYLLRGKLVKYFLISYIAPFFQVGLLPVPIIFFLVYCVKKTLIHPAISIVLYIAIGLLFQTEMMLVFTDMANMFSFISKRAEGFAAEADYWLTGGSNGRKGYPFPGVTTVLLLFSIIWYSYNVIKKMDKKYIFPYNIFLLGFLLGPVANQIELLQRYNLLFYFFRAILIACILWYLIKKRLYVKISPLLFMFLLAYNCFTFF